MNDYKLLKKAYLDNTGYVENFSSLTFDPVLWANTSRSPPNMNEIGYIYLSDPDSKTNTSARAKYRVIRQIPNTSLYSIAVTFEKNSDDITTDIQNIFKELCIYPSSYFSPKDAEKLYLVPFQEGDTVKFKKPQTLNEMLEGGIYDGTQLVNKVQYHRINHGGKSYLVSDLDPIYITMINPLTCTNLFGTNERDINKTYFSKPKNPNTKIYTYIYHDVPLARLMKI
jgi:hypothetical protein